MIIRKATEKDAEKIAELLTEFYNMDGLKEAKDTFLNETRKGHHYLVAEEGGKIIGVVTWLMHGLPKHMMAELDRILITKAARGKGLGKKLVDALIKDANEAYGKAGFKLRKLYLLTHADNKEAQEFYEKIGFKHETTLKEHYYKGRDEFVYSRFF
ncbi:GNAT family N-acetyltransferase [Candidatus Woesearchaeota archaeon]|nr:GNAT family N-acetyltransferase [Candidatus Woesearchaeota archaeon]